MNYLDQYSQKLAEWVAVRDSDLDEASYLSAVNTFWAMTPMISRWLSWNHREDWPDPWHLLNNHAYCDLARALGICYTILLSGREDLIKKTRLQMSATALEEANLVLVDDSKYVLNYLPRDIVNISLPDFKTKFTLSLSDLPVN